MQPRLAALRARSRGHSGRSLAVLLLALAAALPAHASPIADRLTKGWQTEWAALEQQAQTQDAAIAAAALQQQAALLRRVQRYSADSTARHAASAKAARDWLSKLDVTSEKRHQQRFARLIEALRKDPASTRFRVAIDEAVALERNPEQRLEQRLQALEILPGDATLPARLAQTEPDLRAIPEAKRQPFLARIKALSANAPLANAPLATSALVARLEQPQKPYVVAYHPQLRVDEAPELQKALALAKDGRAAEATERLKPVKDVVARRHMFRKLAEALAHRLDTIGIIKPGASRTADADGVPGLGRVMSIPALKHRVINAALSFEAITGWGATALPKQDNAVAVAGFDVTRLETGKPVFEDKLVIPYVARRADEIRAALPKIAPGEARIIALHHSPYNSKFSGTLLGLDGQDRLVSRQKNTVSRVIMLKGGIFDLRSIVERIRVDIDPSEVLNIKDRIATLRLPILIGHDAELVISDAEIDELRLSTERGAFINSGGKLFMVGTEMSGWSETKAAPQYLVYKNKYDFRPFIAAWSGTGTYAADMTFRMMGSSQPKSYGMSVTSGPKRLQGAQDAYPAPTSVMVDSTFDNLYYGFYSYESGGVELIGNEYVDNIVYGPDPHDRSRGYRLAYNTAYGTHEKHGLIISREVDDAYFIGNLTFENKGAGIMLDRESIGAMIYANTGFANQQDGLALFESDCSVVVANDFSGNRLSGIRVRNSRDAFVQGNDLRNNIRAGVEVYTSHLEKAVSGKTRDFGYDPYWPETTAQVAGNHIEGNSFGVTSKGADSVTFIANNFQRQSPRVYYGDYKSLAARLFSANETHATVVASQCKPRLPALQCRFRANGMIRFDDRPLIFDKDQGADCHKDPASVQGRAFLNIKAADAAP
jgi:parallel beta-helix repeat protein